MDKEALQPIRDEDYFTATKAGFEIYMGAEGGDLAVLPGLAVSRQRLPRIIRRAKWSELGAFGYFSVWR